MPTAPLSPFEADSPRALFGDAVYVLRDLKRSYAGLIRTWRPDAHPSEFRHIRGLYEEARARLERAGDGGVAAPSPAGTPAQTQADAPPLDADPAAAWASWEAGEGRLYAHDPAAWADGLRRMVRHAGWELPVETLSGLVERVGSTLRIPEDVADALTRDLCGTFAWQAAAADPATAALAEQVRAAVRADGAERLRILARIALPEAVVHRHPGLTSLVYRALDEATGRGRALLTQHNGGKAPARVPTELLAELGRPRATLFAGERAAWWAERNEVLGNRNLRRNAGLLWALGIGVLVAVIELGGDSVACLLLPLLLTAFPLGIMGLNAWRDGVLEVRPLPPDRLSEAARARAYAEEQAMALAICRRDGLWIHELACGAGDTAADAVDALLADPLSDLLVVGDAHYARAELGGAS